MTAYALIPILTIFAALTLRVFYLRKLLNLGSRYRRGYVYGFTDRGQLAPVVKIGKAKNPAERLRAHKCAAPFGLTVFFIIRVPDEHKAEKALHAEYARWRVRRNGEWFYIHPLMLIDLFLLRLIS
jgi:hypothetical protein